MKVLKSTFMPRRKKLKEKREKRAGGKKKFKKEGNIDKNKQICLK